MTYVRNTWVDETGPPFIAAGPLNNMEEGIEDAHGLADAAQAAADAAQAAAGDAADDLAAHEAEVTGAHGIPAMSAGQGLLWDGRGWTAADLATQAELDEKRTPRGSALPGSPSDGDEFIYQVAEGVAWRFAYNEGSASAYKWEFVGGAPLLTASAGDMTNTNSTDTALTDGPRITLPLAGDYELGLRIIMVVSALSIAVATVYDDASPTSLAVAHNQSQGSPAGFERVNGITAASVLSVFCLNANRVSTRYVAARLMARPIRVS